MNKPIAFMCTCDNTKLSKADNGYITLELLNNESNIICLKNNDVIVNIEKVKYIDCQNSNQYVFYDKDMKLLSHVYSEEYLYVESTDIDNIYHLTFKSWGKDITEYPHFRHEVVGGAVNTYCKPQALVDEFLLLSYKYSDLRLNKNIEICNTLKSIIYTLYADVYSNNNIEFYIYFNDNILRVLNVTTNVMLCSTVDIYDDEEIQNISIPLEDLSKSACFIFDSNDTIVFNDMIIKDGMVIDYYTTPLKGIVNRSEERRVGKEW